MISKDVRMGIENKTKSLFLKYLSLSFEVTLLGVLSIIKSYNPIIFIVFTLVKLSFKNSLFRPWDGWWLRYPSSSFPASPPCSTVSAKIWASQHLGRQCSAPTANGAPQLWLMRRQHLRKRILAISMKDLSMLLKLIICKL